MNGPVQQLIASMDAAAAAEGFAVVPGSVLPRRYNGSLTGAPAFAELSALLEQPHTPAGYVLRVVVRTNVRARWVAGDVPVFLRSGVTALGDAQGELLRAHDPAWAQRFVDREAPRSALRWLLGRVKFLEHKPDGEVQLQVQSFTSTAMPDVSGLLRALAVVVATAAELPAPVTPPPRWSDNRGLAMGLVTVVVLAVFVGAFVALTQMLPR